MKPNRVHDKNYIKKKYPSINCVVNAVVSKVPKIRNENYRNIQDEN